MTAFYSPRLMFLPFYGKSRGDHHPWDHAHESPAVMLIPLYVLAAGAALAGMVGYGWFVGEGWEHFWGHSIAVKSTEHIIQAMHEAPVWAKVLPLVMGLGGIALSYVYYFAVPSLPDRTARAFGAVYTFVFSKRYFDELYDAVFVQPALALGRMLWKNGDGSVIDWVGPDRNAAPSPHVPG